MGMVSARGSGGNGGNGGSSSGSSQEARPARRPLRPPDPPETFSIAMETGDADDEYSREEELASMGAQMQIGRERNSSSSSASEGGSVGGGGGVAGTSSWMDGRGGGRGSPGVSSRAQVSVALNTPSSDLYGEKGCQTQNSYLAGSGAWGGLPLRLMSQGSSLGMANLKVRKKTYSLRIISFKCHTTKIICPIKTSKNIFKCYSWSATMNISASQSWLVFKIKFCEKTRSLKKRKLRILPFSA